MSAWVQTVPLPCSTRRQRSGPIGSRRLRISLAIRIAVEGRLDLNRFSETTNSSKGAPDSPFSSRPETSRLSAGFSDPAVMSALYRTGSKSAVFGELVGWATSTTGSRNLQVRRLSAGSFCCSEYGLEDSRTGPRSVIYRVSAPADGCPYQTVSWQVGFASESGAKLTGPPESGAESARCPSNAFHKEREAQN